MAMDTFFEGVSHEKLPEWEICLQRLKDKDAEVQKDAAAQLRRCVELAVRELSTENFEHFEGKVHRRIFDLLEEKVI